MALCFAGVPAASAQPLEGPTVRHGLDLSGDDRVSLRETIRLDGAERKAWRLDSIKARQRFELKVHEDRMAGLRQAEICLIKAQTDEAVQFCEIAEWENYNRLRKHMHQEREFLEAEREAHRTEFFSGRKGQ